MTSNCCGAEMIEDTDICSKCKEHCVDEAQEAKADLYRKYGDN